jgi:hypothetical protein
MHDHCTKIVVFMYTNNDLPKRRIKPSIPFIIASNSVKMATELPKLIDRL